LTGVFTQSGLSGTAKGSTGSKRHQFFVNNTNGSTTTFALANPGSNAMSVFGSWQPTGSTSPQSLGLFTIPGNGVMANAVANQFSVTGNQTGTLAFFAVQPSDVEVFYFSGPGFTIVPSEDFNGPSDLFETGDPLDVTGTWGGVGGSAATGAGANSVYTAISLVQNGATVTGLYNSLTLADVDISGTVSGTASGSALTFSASHGVSANGCGLTFPTGSGTLTNGTLATSFTVVFDNVPACGTLAGLTSSTNNSYKQILNRYSGSYQSPLGSSLPSFGGLFDMSQALDGTISGAYIPTSGSASAPTTFTGSSNGDSFSFSTYGTTPHTFTGTRVGDTVTGTLDNGASYTAVINWN